MKYPVERGRRCRLSGRYRIIAPFQGNGAKTMRSRGSRGQGQLRIIAGEWRGRRIPVPDADGLRPTGDRVRETLFNWLAPVLPGARCLDLFAGSGALGLEALSRGAAHCDFVEAEPVVAQSLRAALSLLAAGERGAVHAVDALSFLGAGPPGVAGRCDIAFLDPPFGRQLMGESCRLLEARGFLAPEALVYLEYPRGEAPEVPENWVSLREKATGAVAFALYERAA
jgi:16S rRNA (guanine966-N2)-methyltransferase